MILVLLVGAVLVSKNHRILSTGYNSPIMGSERSHSAGKVIRQYVSNPVKISGNVDVDIISGMVGEVSRFDVSVSQARKIISSLKEKAKK